MIRRARKNEVSKQEIEEIIASFNDEGNEGDEWDTEMRIVWFPVTRYQQKCGCRSRWAIMTRFANGDKDLEEEGQLEICTECSQIFPVIAGNVYDDMEYCDECHASAA